jgi:CBS domain-containing protein
VDASSRLEEIRPVSWAVQLDREHTLIDRVVAAVEAMAATTSRVPIPFVAAAVEFFQVFVGQYHERKEEEGLFPVLWERAGGIDGAPLAVLQAEHAEGRGRLRAIDVVLLRDPEVDCGGRLSAYGGFLRNHMAHEAELLTPIVGTLLRPEDDARITETFAAIEARILRSGGGPAMRGLAEALETASRSSLAGGSPRPRSVVARDLMRTRTGGVDSEASLQRAFEEMTALGVRELPVVHDAILVGLLAAHDMDPHRGRLEWTPVRVAMTANPETVTPDMPVTEVARRLREHGFNAFPVVEDGRVLGMIGRHELLAAIT